MLSYSQLPVRVHAAIAGGANRCGDNVLRSVRWGRPAVVHSDNLVSHRAGLSSKHLANALLSRLWFCLPGVFLLGYFAMSYAYTPTPRLLSLMALCAVLIGSCIPRSVAALAADLPAACALLILVAAYQAQFFLAIIDPERVAFVTQRQFALEDLLASYETACIGIIAFCAGALLARRKDQPCRAQYPLAFSGTIAAPSWVFPLIVSTEVATIYLVAKFGVGVMGGEDAALPFRAAGLLFYARLYVLPYLILVWLHAGILRRNTLQVQMALGAMLGHGIADALLRSSRGVLMSLSALLILMVTRVSWRKEVATVVRVTMIFIVLSAMMYPVMNTYRQQRNSNPSVGLGEVLASSIAANREETPFTRMVVNGGESLFFRPSGILSLLSVVRQDLRVNITDVFDTTHYYNRYVMRIDPLWHHADAPSLMGSFYLVAGPLGVSGGMFLFGVVVQLGWRGLLRRRAVLWSAPAQALYVWVVIGIAADGVLDTQFYVISSCAAAVGFVAFLERSLIRPSVIGTRLRRQE